MSLKTFHAFICSINVPPSDDLFHSSDYFQFFTVSQSFSMYFIDFPVESSFYKDTLWAPPWMSEVAFQTDKEAAPAAPITRAKSSPNMGRDLRSRFCRSEKICHILSIFSKKIWQNHLISCCGWMRISGGFVFFVLLEDHRISDPSALASEATEATDAAAKANFLENLPWKISWKMLAGDGIEPMSALLRRRKEVPQQISTACSNCRTGAAARSSTCALCSVQIYRFLPCPFLFRMLFSIEQQWQAMAVTCTCKCLEVSWCLVLWLVYEKHLVGSCWVMLGDVLQDWTPLSQQAEADGNKGQSQRVKHLWHVSTCFSFKLKFI